MTNRSAWYRIRKEMFEVTLNEVRERVGRESAELRSYRTKYDADVGRRWRVSSRDELMGTLGKADVILSGDFHALEQSQKTHMRLLQAIQSDSRRPLAVGVECVERSKQKALDKFLNGGVSEARFLKSVAWNDWGFPWEHYRALFLWARQHHIPMIALDHRKASLRKRDQTAAEILAKWRRNHPEHRLFVIYGDLHLATDKLPRHLERRLSGERIVRVFQNCEQVALRLLKKGLDHKVDVVRFDARTFSVQNVPPWVKWQNYLLWLEQKADHTLDGDGTDWTDPVVATARWIADELKLPFDAGALTVHSADDPDLWDRVRENLRPSQRPWLEMMVEDSRSFYLSTGAWGYLARPSVNHAASLAMQFLHDRMCGGVALNFRFPQDFTRMIWIESIAYFGSKIVNPRRKSNTLLDIRASLSSKKADDRGREALRLALSQKMREMMLSGDRDLAPMDIKPRTRSSWIAAAALLGALLGERLYNGYRKRMLSLATLHEMLKKPVKHPKFDLIYRELLEIIDALPAPYRSKDEKL